MSDLENRRAKPSLTTILNGQRDTLSTAELSSISAFAFKTMIIADYSQRSSSARSPFFADSVRSAFRTRSRIPRGFNVWVAPYLSDAVRQREGFFRSYYFQIRDGFYRDMEGFVVTWGLTPFMLQALAFRWLNQARARDPFPIVEPAAIWNGVPLIWPNVAGPIEWPTGARLGHDTLVPFHNRFLALSGPPAA